MCNVKKVTKIRFLVDELAASHNIHNSLSLYKTTAKKLASSGYIRVHQTPNINLQANTPMRQKEDKKPTRYPHTVNFRR